VRRRERIGVSLADLPQAMRQTRELRGLSIRAAAVEIGVKHPMLQRLEVGFLPMATELPKFAKWLRCPVVAWPD
jgi:ribosome-binding protein aMBF1 (putative translation factor)